MRSSGVSVAPEDAVGSQADLTGLAGLNGDGYVEMHAVAAAICLSRSGAVPAISS